MPLFRPEALRAQDRLYGDVHLVPPISWQIVGYFLFASVAAAGLFLSMASYGRVTVVTGEIGGSKGMLRASPTRSGIVDRILVSEGQSVAAGMPLVRIRLATSDGASTLEQKRAAGLSGRGAILAGRTPGLSAGARARIEGLEAQIAGDRAQADDIGSQIERQRDLIVSAQADLDKVRTIAGRGFLSAHELLQRREKLAERRQDLLRLQQGLSAAQGRIVTEQADVAEGGNATMLLVTAAGAGIVTGITAHPGDPATPGVPLLSIVPAGTRLEAMLDVPPDAAGRLEPGQPIRIAVDAFPYQTFGTVEARLSSISRATVPKPGSDGRSKEAFIVSAPLARETIAGYGQPQPLRPGMTVSARIETGKRSLAGWLFDPILAVARR